ncbi:S-layer homology domain-containing protein [Paenibacillus endoradicis]
MKIWFSIQDIAGLISGKTDNKYDPNNTSTRAEAITLILNMLNKN